MPLPPPSSSSSDDSSSSSSSSSSLDDCCNCVVTIALVPETSTGCGIEVSGGVAYSIGTQLINCLVTDPCDVVQRVYINGDSVLPTLVADGQPIIVTIDLISGASLCAYTSSSCVVAMFMAKMVGNKLVIGTNKRLRLRRR